MLTSYPACTIFADSVVIPASNASVGPKIIFALNPPDTPANAAAIPARGCLLKLKNTTAPRGINITYPASDAIFDITPAKQQLQLLNS